VKALLFTITLLFALNGMAQNKIAVDKIDSLVRQLDLSIQHSKGIARAYIGIFDDQNGRTEECLVIDTVKKKLLKVISVQFVQIKFEDERDNKEAELKGIRFPKDTIKTTYYFSNDSLVKVSRKSAVKDFEFYFNNYQCIERIATTYGKSLLDVDSNVSDKHLSNARNYLENFKSLIPYSTSDIRFEGTRF
jgi:hypothetical protein